MILRYLVDINNYFNNNNNFINADNYYKLSLSVVLQVNNTSECISNAFAANSDKTSSVILEFPVIIYH